MRFFLYYGAHMLDVPEVKIDAHSQELLSAWVHFAYTRTRRHPRMRSFMAGVKSGTEIFDLEKTSECLSRALEYIESLGRENAKILWVGTKPSATKTIEEVAVSLGHSYVSGRWVGGTLTNYKIIRERINYWQDLAAKQKSGELAKYTKQEQLMVKREIERLARKFAGLIFFDSMPKALFIVDTGEEASALHEAKVKHIPTMALLNSDCDPASVTYPIPGNDSATRSIQYILEKAKEAYIKGKNDAGN